MSNTVSASWPGMSRPSTSISRRCSKDVDTRDKPGHDEREVAANARSFRAPHGANGRRGRAPDDELRVLRGNRIDARLSICLSNIAHAAPQLSSGHGRLPPPYHA